MAATGFTPIKIYASSTASSVPLAANLDNTNGAELAINTNDGRLFYKDSGGVVQVMASKATGSIGGATTQVQFNNAGALGGSASLTWNGTVLTSSGFAGPLNGTVGATTPSTGAFTTTTVSTSETLSYGTANGVAYLNGSKVLTSGSALTFDGTNLGVGGAANSYGGYSSLQLSNATNGGLIDFKQGSTALGQVLFNTTQAYIFAQATGIPLLFGVNNAEQMRLTSSLLSVVPGATIQGLTVGRGAGADATNTAVGAGALGVNTTGSSNTALGRFALGANTTGAANTAIGRGALESDTTGSYNTAIGFSALDSNTTASNNTAVGYQAGYTQSGSSPGSNVWVGYQSGYLNSTGGANTALGNTAGYSNTGSYSTLLGNSAGYYQTSGGYNTAIGSSALQGTSGGTNTGSANVAVGNDALKANTTASNNTAVGYQAGYSNTTGTEQVFIGYGAGYSTTTGSGQTFVGKAAGYNNTTGSENSAFGDGTLTSNTTGSYNTALGRYALQANTTASNNTAVGYQAGYSQTGSGAANTYLGYQAGYSGTSYNNTYVGLQAGYTITSGHSNTIIGAYNGNQGGLDIRTASNYIVLSDGDGNPRGIFDGSGNFFVGQTAQINGEKLGVTGSVLVKNTVATGTARLVYQNGSGTLDYFYNYATSTNTGSITTNGTGVLYNITSDYRLKEVIGAVSGSGARIDALQPVDYTMKADGSQQRGFLAHQFQAVYPNSVNGSKDAVDAEGNPVHQTMQASTSEVIADLVAEIQSLRKRLAALEAK